MTDTRHPARWTRRIGAAAAVTVGIGLAAGVPAATASAAPIQCSPQARAAAVAQAAPAIAGVLARHPDLAAELAHLRTLPKNQRRAELKEFRTTHREEFKELRQARTPIRDYRQACHPKRR
ncbi:hemophore-related protein [Williamsia serinedens]|uniref:Hemophore-related protein, Rv0203/Rv1174c family n=1 Tax=Williamsia serinedens TaxID=391736 RepID=A0ABT1H278_9NOCA|nr:hemophore-related protein [Williamsia serinedens]MCP2160765.1 hemophore-related protein, Rv0203/Rv1174c family [Williamsia serinedens]